MVQGQIVQIQEKNDGTRAMIVLLGAHASLPTSLHVAVSNRVRWKVGLIFNQRSRAHHLHGAAWLDRLQDSTKAQKRGGVPGHGLGCW